MVASLDTLSNNFAILRGGTQQNVFLFMLQNFRNNSTQFEDRELL